MEELLTVENLHYTFDTFMGKVYAVRGVSFELKRGETLAIVGESGSGKSVSLKAVMRLIPEELGKIDQGKIMFDGKDLAKISERDMESIRGSQMSMIFQDPMTSLNPTMTIGKQIMEGLTKHKKLNRKKAKKKAIEILESIGIPNAENRFRQYPHQFSGGMRQRVIIAIALACDPQILVADEPTTALDVTIQAQILDVLRGMQEKTGTSIVLITHDLGVVANMAQKVAVMYGGKIVETGTVDEIFFDPKHPYTWGLLSSMPDMESETTRLLAIPGTPPNLADPSSGCPFAARCPHAMEICFDEMPEAEKVSGTHQASCWLLDERAMKVEPPAEARIGGS